MREILRAQGLIESAVAEIAAARHPQVTALHVHLGPMTGVTQKELCSCFNVGAATPLADARLADKHVPVVVYCPFCQAEYELPEPVLLRCPACGSSLVRIVQGYELILHSIEA